MIHRRFWSLFLVFLVLIVACRPSNSGRRYDGGDNDGGDHDGGDHDAGDSDHPDSDTIPCPNTVCGTECCEAEEYCYDDICCVDDRICGATCCARDEVCEFDVCHRDCGDLVRCGESEECCEEGTLCFNGSCITPSGPCDSFDDCSEEEYCDIDLGLCLPRAETAECEYRPGTIEGEFNEVTLLWEWTGGDVFMQPVVAQLSDDNEDGRIDSDDMPDIVISTFTGSVYGSAGTLLVLSGDDHHVVMDFPGHNVAPGSGVAVGDVDGDGFPEIVACGHSGGGLVFNHDGTLLWNISQLCQGVPITDRWSYPAIADLEGDGTVEIITNYTISSGGIFRCQAPISLTRVGPSTVPVDIEGDGDLEIVGGRYAIDENCAVLWENTSVTDGHPAIADFDDDGLPEIIIGTNMVYMLNAEDGTHMRDARTVEGGAGSFAFASAIADFDGDGRPEFVQPSRTRLTVYDFDCLPDGDPDGCASGRTDMVVWSYPTDDGSCCAGPAAFDFEGDGTYEIVYADQHYLRVFRGPDATILYEDTRNSATLWEYPVIADVNNDNHAEIVVASENEAMSGPHQGVRVFGDSKNSWVSTRQIWNQYSYHITNIEPDGTVPLVQERNWVHEELNNFRANQLTIAEGLFAAPDMIITDRLVAENRCPDRLTLTVRVVNQGSSSAPAGMPVLFYRVDEDSVDELIGTVFTSRVLLSGETEIVSIDFDLPPESEGVLFTFYAIVDPADSENLARECNEDNNTSETFDGICEIIGK